MALLQTSATFRKGNHVGRIEMGGLHHAQAFDIRLSSWLFDCSGCPHRLGALRSPGQPSDRSPDTAVGSIVPTRLFKDGSGAVAWQTCWFVCQDTGELFERWWFCSSRPHGI